MKAARKRYKEKNLGADREWSARRRVSMIQRTPKWGDAIAIRAIYKRAAELERVLGLTLHVDHVIPLRGRRVSGLHVHNNLAIVTAQRNIAKSNSYTEM